MKKRNNKNNYELGSYVKAGNAIGTGAGILGGITGDAGLSGLGSGIAAGASFGPIGMVAGGVLGLAGGLIGQGAKKRAERRAKQAQDKQFETDYFNQLNSNLDTNNENPYGIIPEFALGGNVGPGDILKGQVKSDDRVYWNNFVDFVNKKGYTNSPELDKKNANLSRKLFDEYNTLNKGGYNYDTFVPAIQQEIANYRNNAINEVKAGRMGLTNDDGSLYKGKIADYDFDSNYMQGLSNVDGWAGSKTTAWKFPKAYLTEGGSTKEIENTLYNKKMANGGEVLPSIINIEKGELQIDPNSGEILREYVGINPETGGLYEPHNKKGKDIKHNMVSAEEGSFIITKKEAKNYKKALDTNDKYHQNSILQNIRNHKNKQNNKFEDGSDVPPLLDRQNPYTFSGLGAIGMASEGLFSNQLAPAVSNGSTYKNSLYNQSTGLGLKPAYTLTNKIKPTDYGSGIKTTSNNGLNLGGIGDFVAQYGPSLFNMGKGLFGKAERINNITPTINPYKSQILANMPQEVSFEPIRQQLLRQQNTAFNQIDNTTSGSPIARANKQNVIANTQTALGKLMMDKQLTDNQVRGQKASLYSNLGNQEMNEINRVQGINLNIDEQNRMARTTRDNLLSTGLGQLQQTYLNNKTNRRKADMDKMQLEALKQMFPSILPYLDKITG